MTNYIAIELNQGFDYQSQGFPSGASSTDGKLMVIDKGDNTKAEGIGYVSLQPRPSYVTVEMAPNWPNLTQKQAIAVTSIMASSEGAADGYYWKP